MRLSIIIPFYQRQAGILPRAVASVVAQSGVFEHPDIQRVDLIVVDDASPVAAETEIAEIQFPENLHCTVVRQENRGPGGARNRGLDMADDEGIVALLDSDDEWTPEHLERAVKALNSGCDVYGSNWIPLGDYPDAMSMPVRQSLNLKPTAILENAGEIDGDPLLSEMTAPMCKLSGLVYRASRFPGLRFDYRFRNASEDVLFIYSMMLTGPRVMISTQPEVRSGRGVNVYESADWGSPASLSVIYDQTLATKLAHEIVGSRPEARALLQAQLRRQRASFAANLWHMLSRARVPLRQAVRQLALDPLALVSTLTFPLQRVVQRLKAN